ncbi:MAG: hypothetical protein QOE61_3821 [Micromonosporaceae bacterium]|jgi:hypothetical protein|nr:hypothetical protein [Micromonosporaceae bacterium]
MTQPHSAKLHGVELHDTTQRHAVTSRPYFFAGPYRKSRARVGPTAVATE